jgi:hypothetical protein
VCHHTTGPPLYHGRLSRKYPPLLGDGADGSQVGVGLWDGDTSPKQIWALPPDPGIGCVVSKRDKIKVNLLYMKWLPKPQITINIFMKKITVQYILMECLFPRHKSFYIKQSKVRTGRTIN